MIQLKKQTVSTRIWIYFENFCKQTTIHGFNIIGMPNINWLERLFWLLMVSLAATGAICVTISNFIRFSANPTVISIQKDYRNWQTHIPAVTGCLNQKVDLQKAENYILRKWNVSKQDSKYDYYMEFLENIANASYESFYKLSKFAEDTTLDIDMDQMVINVHPKITGTFLTADKSDEFKWNIILIELGVCFSVFSKFASLFSVKNKENLNQTVVTSDELLLCHYLNGLCYARFDSDDSFATKYYVHSYTEVPDISTKQYHFLANASVMEINYRAVETQPSAAIRNLRPIQRKCRFDDEPMNKNSRAYSISICEMNCRYDLAIRLCGCKPFFYHFFEGPTCNVSGLLCLSKYVDKLTETPTEMGCKCPQTCHFINYLPESPKLTVWKGGVYFDQRITFRWGLLHPTTKYRREIIFGFGDFIVSIGGTLNLFLGISFMSMIEIVILICEGIVIDISIRLKLRNYRKRYFRMKRTKVEPLVNTYNYLYL